jgi:hypothetical protein
MKNIIFGIAAFFLLFYATGCSKLLEENPKAVATETFYKTADEIQSAVYAIYRPIRDAVGANGGTWVVNEAQEDYGVGRLSYLNISNFEILSSTNLSRIQNMWTSFYQAIRNANLVILNASQSTEVPQDQINQFTAEAKFLRAFCYFYLVRNWAGVPIRTEDNMIEPDVPRSSVDDVYALILSDLQYAEANLPETQSMVGRATKDAARAVLTDVYLNRKQWPDASSKALEIINSGRYSLVSVQKSADFLNIFGPDVVNTPEEVFYLKYDGTSDGGYCYIGRFSHSPSFPQYYNTTGVFALFVEDSLTNNFITTWDNNDLRKRYSLYSADIGFGPRSMLFKKFIDPASTDQNCKDDWPAYRYADILLYYAEADCRANNGPTADGIEKLNMVHRRAYGYDPLTPSPVDFVLSDYNQDTFLDLVLKEMGYEQIDEGKRYLILRRWGPGKLTELVKFARGLDISEDYLLYPIPSVEYDYNNAISPESDQNPGY